MRCKVDNTNFNYHRTIGQVMMETKFKFPQTSNFLLWILHTWPKNFGFWHRWLCRRTAWASLRLCSKMFAPFIGLELIYFWICTLKSLTNFTKTTYLSICRYISFKLASKSTAVSRIVFFLSWTKLFLQKVVDFCVVHYNIYKNNTLEANYGCINILHLIP